MFPLKNLARKGVNELFNGHITNRYVKSMRDQYILCLYGLQQRMHTSNE